MRCEPCEFEELFDKIREICESKRNSDNANFWQLHAKTHWRGTAPKIRTQVAFAPFTVEPEAALWKHILDFDIQRYFTDPQTYLEIELKKTIYRFGNFDDCTCVGKTIPICLGVPFETTLFGMEAVYSDFESPWIGRSPVINAEEDLEKLPEVDFYKSGMMPLGHRFYKEIKDILPDDFNVVFPEWERSPFGVLWQIRGIDNLLIDMHEKPDFVHRLFERVTNERKRWIRKRANFLNEEIGQGNILNDEVGSPVISPEIYEEFILPSEIELGNFHGGISYWHSCGDTTDFVKLIRRIPGLSLFHVSPCTDLKTAVEEFGKNDIPLQICVDPTKEVHMASRKEMERKLKGIVEICGGVAYTVRADGLQKLLSLDVEIKKIKEWIRIAREVLA